MCFRNSLNFFVRRASPLALVMTALILAGCDADLSGTYEEVDGWGRLEFSGDQVYITLAVVNTTIVADYRVERNQIIIEGPAGPQVYILTDNGTLAGGPGMTFVKRR